MLPINGTAKGWAGPNDNYAGRRYYNATPGQTIDAIDLDANTLNSQGFAAIGDSSGPTSVRPNNIYLRPGWTHIDTTIPAVVAWDGATWRNVITGATA
jgi:hypothetical protein